MLRVVSIAKNKTVLDILNQASSRTNRIVIHTLQFLKLYLIHQYDTTGTVTVVDHTMLFNIMKIICVNNLDKIKTKEVSRIRESQELCELENSTSLHEFSVSSSQTQQFH